jgi:chaperonin cofactor prefoldin
VSHQERIENLKVRRDCLAVNIKTARERVEANERRLEELNEKIAELEKIESPPGEVKS